MDEARDDADIPIDAVIDVEVVAKGHGAVVGGGCGVVVHRPDALERFLDDLGKIREFLIAHLAELSTDPLGRDPEFIRPLGKVRAIGTVEGVFFDDVVNRLAGERVQVNLARHDHELAVGMDQACSGVEAVVAKNHHLAGFLMRAVALPIAFHDADNLIERQLLQIFGIIGAMDDDLMNIRDGIKIGNYPDLPAGAVFWPFADTEYFRRRQGFIARAKRALRFAQCKRIIGPFYPAWSNDDPPLRLDIRYILGHISTILPIIK